MSTCTYDVHRKNVHVHQRSARLTTCVPPASCLLKRLASRLHVHSLEETRLAAEIKHLACASARAQSTHFIEERRLAAMQDDIGKLG